jgi:putative endonuclease
MEKDKPWYVYIVECFDSTLYTGITPNLAARTTAHNTGKGAKYTKGRSPVKLIYSERCNDRSSASVREAGIKRMTKVEKIKLIVESNHHEVSRNR